MATTITKTVGVLSGGGSSGRDHTDVAAAIAALKAGTTDLVGADQAWVIECYNDGGVLSGTASLTGITVDATHFVTIRAAAGQSFKDNANKLTNALRYNPSNGVAWQWNTTVLSFNADYTVIEGLQFKGVGGSGNVCVEQTSNGPNAIIRNCIFETNDSSTGAGCTRTLGATHINCVGVNTAGGTGFNSNGNSSKYRNCTAIQMGSASAFGFRGNYDSPLYLNCAAFGFGTCFRSGTSGSSNYNASGDATAPGTNNFRNLTFANQFQNVASTATMDFRTKSGNGLQVGTRDQANTSDLDIVGSARSTTTPTIGAWEQSSGGTTINAQPGNAVAAGVQANITIGGTISCSPGNAVAAGVQANINLQLRIAATPGNAAAAGVQATVTMGSAEFQTQSLANNEGIPGVRSSVPVSWTWFPVASCRVGSLGSPVNGTGTTEADGTFILTSTMAGGTGFGLLIVAELGASEASDRFFMQYGTIA